MDSDTTAVILLVGFLAYRSCDLFAVRAKLDLTVRRTDLTKPPFDGLSGFQLRLLKTCSWLNRQIPQIARYGILGTMLIFGWFAILESQNHVGSHQQALALVAAIVAVAISAMGMAVEMLRNELDRIRP